jgi:hypothetical protein
MLILIVKVRAYRCEKGGYEEFGFKNQGRCIAFVNKTVRAP